MTGGSANGQHQHHKLSVVANAAAAATALLTYSVLVAGRKMLALDIIAKYKSVMSHQRTQVYSH